MGLPNERNVVHMKLTIPKAFVGFGTFGAQELDQFRLLQWKPVLANWFDTGLQSCFFFLHFKEDIKAIEFAKFAQEQLSQK